MRLSSIFTVMAVFAAAACLCLIGARFAVSIIEDNSRTGVLNTLDDNGLTWAEVDADGLQVYLAGTAPSEAARFRALSLAGTMVDASRILDQMVVEEKGLIAPPRFSMEILRNDSGVSLIGLVPAAMDRESFIAEIEEAASGQTISDFLESADYPEPSSWTDATDYALRSLRGLGSAKISLDANRVSVIAMTESLEAKAEIEEQLSRRVPDSLALTLDISAPRPVITPFTLRVVLEDGTARFDACSADTEDARDAILAAGYAIGVGDGANCTIGLGVPTPKWSIAAEQAITALSELGGGALTISDADISLLALQGTDQSLFDDVVGALDSNLPEVFALTAKLPAPPVETESETPEFTATLSPEGLVQLRGRIGSVADRKLIDSVAKARFSSDGVYMSARIDESLPTGWTLRILAALDSLAYLSNGAVSVSPDDMLISGDTGNSEAGSMISGLLAERLGDAARFSLNVNYEEKLDPVVSIPTPEVCAERIAEIQVSRKITFEPGSAKIDVAGANIMDDIADILKECGAIAMEIGGHTDSQGRETMNQQLSQARAQTVLGELRMRRVLTGSITAVGYGESQPIADNGTEEGRDANRRIEFKLIKEEVEGEGQSELESEAEPSEEQQTEDAASEDGPDPESEAEGADEADIEQDATEDAQAEDADDADAADEGTETTDE